jgi:hypothetical protein
MVLVKNVMEAKICGLIIVVRVVVAMLGDS